MLQNLLIEITFLLSSSVIDFYRKQREVMLDAADKWLKGQ